MHRPRELKSWTRHVVYRSERLRTTWKFRIALLVVMFGALWLTSGWWTVTLARSLVCDANGVPSDAIVVENFEIDNYLTFERAGELRRDKFASRVLVPIAVNVGTQQPNVVALGTAHVVAEVARLGAIEVVPIREIEPISLNAARDVLEFVQRERIRSVIVVSPYFRSRRSTLVYGATLARAGVRVTCEPVRGTLDEWSKTWHGIQSVAEQWLKLQYYRFYVLPFRSSA